MLGSRWSPKSYDLREFLARNRIPYQWLDVEAADRDGAVEAAASPQLDPEDLNHLPLVLFPGRRPTGGTASLGGRRADRAAGLAPRPSSTTW